VEGRHDLAAGLARRALEALELSEDELSIAVAKQLLAYIELERGDANAALGLLREARPTVDRLGDAETRARFLLEEARALAGTGEPDAARELAIEVAPVLERTARVDAGRCFVVLGDLWVEFGEPDAATGAYDVAIAKLSGHRSPWLARAYKQKSALLEAGGDRDGALELLKRALDAEVDVSLHPRPA
ncbi:MAG: tetratricopeptide repeat protein, partial [Gaiellaceae bacterium]